jgi:hypothetical protein
MKINRHNYEAFLLDQLEGRLSVEQQQELEQFLGLNPDCAGELTELESCFMEGKPLSFPHSASLKKGFPDAATVLTEQNFDMFSIARLEQDLSEEQTRAHQAMLEVDDHKAAQWIQWQQSRMIPETVVFPEKGRLYRRKESKSRLIWMSVVSAAAVLILLLILIGRDQDLPSQEAYVPAFQGTESVQAQENLSENETVAEEGEPVYKQNPAVKDDPRGKTLKADPAPVFSSELCVKFMEPATPVQELPANSLSLIPGTISADHFNRTSMIGQVDADRIDPLHISPVPVHTSTLTLAQVYDQGLQELAADYVEENNISLWTIANAGIKGINKVAGSDISLLASRDEDGDISGFRLKSKRFSITRPLQGEE